MNSPTVITTTPIAERARKRIARRLLPYLFFLYIIAYLDRVNLSYAALEMGGALGFTSEVIGFGAGIFFIGYFLLEVPGAILVERWSARAWIARIMISWGIVAVFTGFVHTPLQFYSIRFLLGASEAGFFPGIVVYLSHWFRYEDRAKAMAMFMAAQPISNIVGSPISGLLLGIHWLGLAGWRWLFILEGIPAVLFGVVTIFYLTDWPQQANWLPEDEKQWISGELEREKKTKQTGGSLTLRQVVGVLLLALALFFMAASVYGFNFWLPTIIKKLSGLSNLLVTLVAVLPYCVGLIAILLVGWSSDRTGERRWHAALCMIVASIGLGLSVVSHRTDLAILMFCLAAVGMYGYLPAFWSLPTSFLTGTAAAASIGVVNSIGNLGGFAGPYAVGYITKRAHTFSAGVLCLSASALLAGGLVLLLRMPKHEAKHD
ncbi:MAG TPA: MFS transporter [Terriglobales bacterium]|nr:MFS transporter [Terriglobales bacterium]